MTSSSLPDGSAAAPAVLLEFKGTTLSVTAIVIGDVDTSRLGQALQRKLAEAPGFFDGELALLDLSRLPPEATASVDLSGIVALLRGAGMLPVAARGLAPAAAQAAEALGLAVLAAAPATRAQSEPARPAVSPAWAAAAASAAAAAATPAAAPAAASGKAAGAQPERSTPAAGQTEAAGGSYATITALVIERPLRSGQRVYARGRDLVLLAGISPGAEVIADGSIHCYGPLRGRALAGASGDAAARVFAADFQAELVSIAGVWRTFEANDEQIRGGEPVRVSLHDDGASQALVIEPISGD